MAMACHPSSSDRPMAFPTHRIRRGHLESTRMPKRRYRWLDVVLSTNLPLTELQRAVFAAKAGRVLHLRRSHCGVAYDLKSPIRSTLRGAADAHPRACYRSPADGFFYC